MGIMVRPADTDDAITIFQFICELEETPFDYMVFEPHYMANIRNENYIYLVALDEANAVNGYISCHGQVLLHHCGKVFEIQELFVAKAYRNNGVGQLLLRSLEEILSRQEVISLEVTAHIKRTKTHEFYRKSGFSQTHAKFTRKPGN